MSGRVRALALGERDVPPSPYNLLLIRPDREKEISRYVDFKIGPRVVSVYGGVQLREEMAEAVFPISGPGDVQDIIAIPWTRDLCYSIKKRTAIKL